MPLDHDLRAILVHVEYIREKIDSVEERAKEDRALVHEHLSQDEREFTWIKARLNRLGGGLAFLVFLLGAGAAWARLVLD